MDERNFRFYGFGQENNSNSLFYNDVFLLMSQKQLNPTISILISIENENDLIANNFWSDGRIIQLLTNAGAKAIRIKKDSQQNEFQQFNELFSVQAFPSLYVFGPSSAGPSFIYSSTYPDYQQFASDFSTLTYSPTPAFQPPQLQQQQSQQEQQQSHPQPAQLQPQPAQPQPQPAQHQPPQEQTSLLHQNKIHSQIHNKHRILLILMNMFIEEQSHNRNRNKSQRNNFLKFQLKFLLRHLIKKLTQILLNQLIIA